MNFIQRAAILFFVVAVGGGTLGAVAQSGPILAGVAAGVFAFVAVGVIFAAIEWSINGVAGLKSGWCRLLGRD